MKNSNKSVVGVPLADKIRRKNGQSSFTGLSTLACS